MHNVSLLDDERGERVLSQLLSFPAGKHDDAVDVCGTIGRVIDEAHPGIVTTPEPNEPTNRYRRRESAGGANWKTA